MSLRDLSDGGKNDGSVERSKVALGRTPASNGKTPQGRWWRVTVYAGDEREVIDQALDEALRVDAELLERFR